MEWNLLRAALLVRAPSQATPGFVPLPPPRRPVQTQPPPPAPFCPSARCLPWYWYAPWKTSNWGLWKWSGFPFLPQTLLPGGVWLRLVGGQADPPPSRKAAMGGRLPSLESPVFPFSRRTPPGGDSHPPFVGRLEIYICFLSLIRPSSSRLVMMCFFDGSLWGGSSTAGIGGHTEVHEA